MYSTLCDKCSANRCT